jgi:hypothetical protein
LETIENLSLYFQYAQSTGLSIDTDAISSAFLKTKKVRGAKSDEDTKSLIKNAFLHFQSVFLEFEIPGQWRISLKNPNSDCSASLDVLSNVFMMLYEEIEQKSLIWSGRPDKNLDEMLRRILKDNGFKERTK